MIRGYEKTLTYGLLAGWILYLFTLYPPPLQEAQYLVDNQATMLEIVVVEAKRNGRNLSEKETSAEVEKQIAVETSRIWWAWLLRAISALLGILSVFAFLKFGNRASWSVIATCVLFLGVWLWPYVSGAAAGVSYIRFASGVFATGSFALIGGFLVFNVVLPILYGIATAVFVWSVIRATTA
jgi:hypothetical protein